MLIFNYGHKVYFYPRLFLIFKKWTKKMSKIEKSKYFWEKKIVKNIINSQNNLKKNMAFHPFSIPTTLAIFLIILVSFS